MADARDHQEFQAARMRFEHDFAAFRAAVRAGVKDGAATELAITRLAARARALVEWAAALKARPGAG